MAPHSSTLAWKIPWMEEPGGLLSFFTFMHWRRKWQPTPAFLPGHSQGWRSPVGCRLWGPTELDSTEVTQQQQLRLPKTSLVAQWLRIYLLMQKTWFNPWVGKILWRMKWHSSILNWEISWTEDAGRRQSMESQGVRPD